MASEKERRRLYVPDTSPSTDTSRNHDLKRVSNSHV